MNGRAETGNDDQFDLIIFDIPLILAVTDAQVMANKADGVLFVISRERAVKDEVRKAKDLLHKIQYYVLGVILNRGKQADNNYYYYYGER